MLKLTPAMAHLRWHTSNRPRYVYAAAAVITLGLLKVRGQISHTGHHTSNKPSEKATDNSLDISTTNPLGK